MQALGVLFLTAAIWFVYSGVSSFRPIATALAILQDPSNAGAVIDGAKDAAKSSKYVFADNTTAGANGTTVGGTSVGIGVNPFASYTVTAPYGQTGHAGTYGSAHVHQGIDYGMPSGTSLPAVLNGTFSRGNSPLGGYTATVNGTGVYKGWTVIYMHCSKFLVQSGDKIVAGEFVALSGGGTNDPGKGDATGPHLHFEVHHNGAVVNPASFWTWAAGNKTNLSAGDASDKAGTFTSPSTSNPFLSGAN